MKVVILHGPGEVGKRAELLRVKKRYLSEAVVSLDLKQNSLEQLKSVILSRPLFGTGERLVVVENAPEKLDLTPLQSRDDSLTLLILAGQLRADGPLLGSARTQGAKIFVFEGEKELSVFPYLDALLEKRPQAFKELEKLLAGYNGVYVLTMIFYGLRRNILPLPASSFLRQKITAQKKYYQESDWERLYRRVLDAEFRLKSGLSEEAVELTLLTQAMVKGKF